jgi:tetratricopeptide (TPR) repeat protein
VKGVTRKMKTCSKLLILLGLATALTAVAATSAQAFQFDYKLAPEITDAMNQHDTTVALQQIKASLGVDPYYAPLYLLRGEIFYARGEYDKALEQFDTALDKKSSLYEAMYYRGLVYLEKDDIKAAEKDFSKGLKKTKNHEKALFHNGMGLLLIKEKKYSDADLQFRKAITLNPDRAEFYANLGDANYFAKLYPLAISEYNKVIKMDTTYLDVYFRLARAYVAQGQYNDALDQLRTVLTRDSMYAGAWQEIGRLYTLAGVSASDRETKEQRFKDAIGSYRKFLSITHDSSTTEVFFNIGRAYFNLGGFPEADSAFEYVLARGDVPKGIYIYLGRGYIAQEEYQKGIDFLLRNFDWMKQQDPDWTPGIEDADTYNRIGSAYRAMDDWENAATYYVKAYDLNTNDPRYALDAAVAYHQLKDYETALKYYQKRIELGPDAWNVYLNAGGCAYSLENYELAAQYFEKVTELDPTKERAFALLSDTYLNRLEDCENGVKWTKKWLEMDSTNCDALKSLGFAYFGGICPPDYIKAVSYFSRTLACYKAKGMNNCSTADVMLYMAQAYHLQAAALAEKDKKDESKPYYKNAYEWYQKVLKCDPGNKDAQEGSKQTEFEY